MSKPVPLSSQQEPSYNGEGGESLSKIELAMRDVDEILDELTKRLIVGAGIRLWCEVSLPGLEGQVEYLSWRS